MEREFKPLVVVNIDEIANRWQLPVDRIKYFITDCDMNPAVPEKWGVKNWDFLTQEMKKFGPIAQMEANAPASSVRLSDDS